MSRAVVLTYHAIGDGPPPLCVSPALLEAHADAVAASGATVLTVAELAAALRERRLPDRAVALTFDDGFADTAAVAAPILAARGLRATVFCVSGFLGATSDWPTQPAGVPRAPLATADALRALAASGWEIGAHGVDHAPLDALDPDAARLQVARSAAALEAALGVQVRSFAFPYGRVPVDAAASLEEAGLEAGCTTIVAPVGVASDPLLLPRVDAHYVRRPALLRLALRAAGDPYLALRRAGAAVGRTVRR